MMSVIHKFVGQWGEVFKWEGARFRRYGKGASEGASETWLIGKAEGAQNFALRYYELEVAGHSRKETHAHDHGILFMRGTGHVLIENDVHGVTEGDVVYIAPNETHQIINTGDEVLGWLCVIPARRVKNDKTVWAEEGLDDLVVVSD